jgi:hypothetical protein
LKTASAKAKGRRAAQETRDLILAKFSDLESDDLRVTPSGVTGEDLLLSPKAQSILPFCFEVKNQEKLNIWQSLKQAKSHVSDKRTPLLVFKKNHEVLYVVCEFEKFLDYIKKEDDVPSLSY